MENKENKDFYKFLTALELTVKLLDKAIELKKLENTKSEGWQRKVPKYPLGGFISNDSKKEIEDYLKSENELVSNTQNMLHNLDSIKYADLSRKRCGDVIVDDLKKKESNISLKKMPFGDYPRAKNFPNDPRKICFVFVNCETREYKDIYTRGEFEKLRKEGTFIFWRWV